MILKKQSCSNFCQIFSSSKIRVIDFKAPCLFFRKRGQEFNLNQLVPEGVCPDLFFHLYPQYLSLLYDGQPQEVILNCPGAKRQTTWRLRGGKLLFYPFLNLGEKFFRLIGKPKDLPNKKIILELLKSEDNCPQKCDSKNRFEFNQYQALWQKKYFCPALFYTLYPFFNYLKIKKFPKKESLKLQCPSEKSSIIIEII